jgi:hypothetical protein
MKTNLEELNYRFRKELLNNYGYYLFFNILNQVETEKLSNNFVYEAWVKGLFKTNGVDNKSLVDNLEIFFEESLSIEDEFWNEKYERSGNLLDLINISALVSLWINLFYQLDNYKDLFWEFGLKLANSDRSKEYFDFTSKNLNKDVAKENLSRATGDVDRKWLKYFTEKYFQS